MPVNRNLCHIMCNLWSSDNECN